jgi:hypothetical protein
MRSLGSVGRGGGRGPVKPAPEPPPPALLARKFANSVILYYSSLKRFLEIKK